MLCPSCKVELKMTERERIEIDYCPQCRGVWLDRGELDKIIERSAQLEQPRFEQPRSDPRHYGENHRGDSYKKHYDDDDRRYHDKRHYRKKSFLGELLDF